MRFSLTPRSAGAAVASLIPGLGLALVIALIATVIGDRFPVVGAPVVAIVLGLVVAAVRARVHRCNREFASRRNRCCRSPSFSSARSWA